MKLTKNLITDLFLSKDWDEFYRDLLSLGFKRAKYGCRKKVFIHKHFSYVVKVAEDSMEAFPSKRSKVAKFFLWPEFTAEKRSYKLYFQPKAKIATSHFKKISQLKRLQRNLKNENARWHWSTKLKNGNFADPHAENIAKFKGKLVIIDY